jgi:hypothetical protein
MSAPPKISARLDKIEARIEELQVAKIETDIKETQQMVERKVMGELDALRKVDNDYQKLLKLVTDQGTRLENIEKQLKDIDANQRLYESVKEMDDWHFTDITKRLVALEKPKDIGDYFQDMTIQCKLLEPSEADRK